MAQAGRSTTTTCPAARLAREAIQVLTARQWAERSDVDAFDDLQERLEAIEDAVTYVRATSPLGAFFQALVLSGELDPQLTWVGDAEDAPRMVRRLARLCASIASELEKGLDIATVDRLRSYYMTRPHDPLSRLTNYLAPANLN